MSLSIFRDLILDEPTVRNKTEGSSRRGFHSLQSCRVPCFRMSVPSEVVVDASCQPKWNSMKRKAKSSDKGGNDEPKLKRSEINRKVATSRASHFARADKPTAPTTTSKNTGRKKPTVSSTPTGVYNQLQIGASQEGQISPLALAHSFGNFRGSKLAWTIFIGP
jgi:hypothetical protein